MVDLDQLVSEAQQSFSSISDSVALEEVKAKYLGKSGLLTEMLKGLGKLDPEQRKSEGAKINAAKTAIEGALNQRRNQLADDLLQARLSQEAIDVSLPGRGRGVGSLHPVMRTWERVEEIFIPLVLKWHKVLRLRTTGITFPRSIVQRTIQQDPCKILSMSRVTMRKLNLYY